MKIVSVYQDQTAARKPSAWSVITALLRQSSHSAVTAESRVLRSALFCALVAETHTEDIQCVSFPLKAERLKPLTLA